jgi:phytoene dehydrogenase-like protein
VAGTAAGTPAGTVAETVDAVVIGSGPNGLVAANLLADAGWSVLVLEAQPTLGGAVRSARDVHPDYVHDTFSAFYPLGAASPVMRRLRLEDHGVSWLHAPAVLGNPLPDGSWALLHRAQADTVAALDAATPGDGEAWRRLCLLWDHVGDALIDTVMSPFPPIRGGLRLLRRTPAAGGMSFVRLLLEPAIDVGEQLFRGDAARLLLMGNAGHSDLPLDAPGSGLMALLLAMLGQTVGFPVPRGGAGELTAGLASRLRSLGGEIRTGVHVDGIEVRGGAARAVTADDGSRITVRRAVLASTLATQLYGDLVDWAELPRATRRGMRAFRLDPSTIKVDWALDGPVPWSSPPPVAPGTVHIADSPEQLVSSLQRLAAHHVPADPFLLVGQMTTSDPSRSPAGTESLWAYTHVPQDVRGDDADEGLTGSWDRDECERMADRMQRQLERHAPDLASRIVARRVLGPRELEERDENLVGGAINGGTGSLQQQLVFRPIPGTGRAETAIRRLYLASASAHPGGGVHGAAGANAARAAIAHHRLSHGLAHQKPTRRST